MLLPWHGNLPRPVQGHPDPGVQEAPTPIAAHWCGTRQSRCGPGSSSVSQAIFGSEAQFPSGDTKVQEANAASRKAADVDLVSHPEYAVMVANQGTS